MDVWIGTSGYSYPDWVGRFYPPGTRPTHMLRHYCRHFPLVELNFTFYQPPTDIVLIKLAERVPRGFQFLVKLPRTLSHERTANDLASFERATAALASRNQLLGVLCQFPQSAHAAGPLEKWVEFLAEELPGKNLAVEFRHSSWARPEVAPWLGSLGVHLVSVDVPPVAALYPTGWVQSTRFAYVRFHSRAAANWYLSDKDRYDYDYADATLREWANALVEHRQETDRVFLLFNNCQRSQAAANAQRMRTILLELGKDLHIVDPVADGGD